MQYSSVHSTVNLQNVHYILHVLAVGFDSKHLIQSELGRILKIVRCVHTELTDFLSDSQKLSDKDGLYSNVQKLKYCSESDSEYDFQISMDFKAILSDRTVSRNRTPFSAVGTHHYGCFTLPDSDSDSEGFPFGYNCNILNVLIAQIQIRIPIPKGCIRNPSPSPPMWRSY